MQEDISTLRIARSPEGQWLGRLLIGSEEIVLGAYKLPQEVEQIATRSVFIPIESKSRVSVSARVGQHEGKPDDKLASISSAPALCSTNDPYDAPDLVKKWST